MDSKARLALMAKAKKVFENDDNDDTFLAFPVTPLVYDRSDLDLDLHSSSSDSSSEANPAAQILSTYKKIETFSLLVNLIPEGNTWMPGETRFLWDEYEQVLSQGICAASTRTPEEEARYQAARDFLKDIDEDGIARDSQQLVVYKQYEDAYASLRDEFEMTRFSDAGELAQDEEVLKHWNEVEEPAFRARLADVERQWTLEGYKLDVEQKQNELISLGARSPLPTWLDWKASFDPSIDALSDPTSQMEYFPTSFSPANALEDGNWQSFSLDSSTIETLVAEAPADLKERFNIGSRKTTIESMNLEFSRALLNRHWFDRDVLHARFWRLQDDSKILSDGAVPAAGDCPAYVSGVVFARNIAATEKTQEQSGSTPRPVRDLQLQFSQLYKGQSLATRIDPALLQTIQPVRIKPRTRSGSRAAVRPVRLQATASIARPGVVARPALKPVSAKATIAPAQIRPAALQFNPRAIAMKQLINQRNFPRLDIAKPGTGTGIKPPPPPPPESDPDEIQILAFICTRVPRCPDPDPSLSW